MDNFVEIVKYYVENYLYVCLLYQVNVGVSVVCNCGIEVVMGKYVVFVDVDDEVYFIMYEMLMIMVLEDDFDVVQCNVDWCFCEMGEIW